MSDYYEGYQLTDGVHDYMLDDLERVLLDACIFLVENKSDIRKTSKNFCFSKSALHRRIHSKLPGLSYELYQLTIRQLNINLARSIEYIRTSRRSKKVA